MFATWNAVSSLDRLMDDVMGDVMGRAFGTATNNRLLSPDVDIRANSDEIAFSLDVPGVKREDLELTVENGVLSVKGERKHDFAQGEQVLLGRPYGAFSRSFNLPDYADVEHLTADLVDGVLTIRVPKLASAKPRKIQIGGESSGPKQLAEKPE
jgi:HSP20 family protein